jgi:hypothetical protein
VNSTLRVVLFLYALFIFPNDVLSTPKNRESNDWDSVSVGQTGLLIRGSREGIAFKEDASVMWGSNVIGQCSYQAEYRNGSRVYVSPLSPKKEFFVILCWEDQMGGKAAWVIDSNNRTVLAKNLVRERWGIASWVGWSPNEDFALFHAVGEITMGAMVAVNLISGRPQEIHFRNFTRNPRLQDNIQDEIMDFDRDQISWINSTTFKLRLDVRCNPYEGDESCRTRIIRSHPARVNLSPFAISYGNTRRNRSAQGHIGEAAKKGSRKQNSGTETGDVRASKLTVDLKEQLASEMVRNAYNPEWFRKCLEEAGGIDQIVDIVAISLGNSDARQYLLSGKIAENGESCAFGARSPMYWIYENRAGRIRLLAEIGAADSVKVISRRTNGYRDIQIGAVYNAGRSFGTFYMKYNGTVYK